MHENEVDVINQSEIGKVISRTRRDGKGLCERINAMDVFVEEPNSETVGEDEFGNIDDKDTDDAVGCGEDIDNEGNNDLDDLVESPEFTEIDVGGGKDDPMGGKDEYHDEKNNETGKGHDGDEDKSNDCVNNGDEKKAADKDKLRGKRYVENWPQREEKGKYDCGNRISRRYRQKQYGGNAMNSDCNLSESKVLGDDGMVGGVTPTPNEPPRTAVPIKDDGLVSPILNNGGFIGRRFTPINGAVFNRNTIRMLRCARSGRISAMTNLFTYIYQIPLVHSANRPLLNVLDQVIAGEIKNINLLGGAIVSFGGNPRFSNGQGTPWSSRFINYQNDSSLFASNNIRMIKAYIRELECVRSRETNQSLIALIGEIIEEEQRYINLFTNL